MTRRAREFRNHPTAAEIAIWHKVAYFRPRFTRQLVVERFIVNLACREVRLAVEFDGSQHIDSVRDVARTRRLEALGWTVIRF
ncbi:endonuclease domain-containing protein [Sphingomonas faeni]|uniref:endonuclease domain-containing protein n=1 Tax=Sphingomonas faeni TaxID=185950 RepID=UPI003344A5C8